MKRLFITLLILTAGIIVPESVLAQQRYQIGVCDWMVLKRQKLGEFKLAKELGCDGKGKWWEGLDPKYLYGINLREYETVAEAANSRWSPPQAGIFSGHLEYAEWYAKWWALRMMDAVDKYNPDFIYTDGTDQQPFSGSGTGTGYKCDAMQRVIADFYNKTLDRRGKLLYHRFSFYSRQRWGHLCLVYDCAKGW